MAEWKLKSKNVSTDFEDGEDIVHTQCRHEMKMRIQNEVDLIQALDLMQEFVDKVESGRAKSTETYNKYKSFLAGFKE